MLVVVGVFAQTAGNGRRRMNDGQCSRRCCGPNKSRLLRLACRLKREMPDGRSDSRASVATQRHGTVPPKGQTVDGQDMRA